MKVTSLFLLVSLASCGSRIEKPVEVIDSKNFAYKECYNESESFKKGIVKEIGQVSISFNVLPDGKVNDEKILLSDFKGDANFHACLLEVTREMKFPLTENGAVTNLTKVLNFSTKTKMNE